jgi:hypothetical protein
MKLIQGQPLHCPWIHRSRQARGDVCNHHCIIQAPSHHRMLFQPIVKGWGRHPQPVYLMVLRFQHL